MYSNNLLFKTKKTMALNNYYLKKKLNKQNGKYKLN